MEHTDRRTDRHIPRAHVVANKDLSWFISSVIPDNLSEENKNCLVVLGVNKFLESSLAEHHNMLTEQLAAYYNSSVSGRKEKFLNKKRVVKREASKKKEEVSSSDKDEDVR